MNAKPKDHLELVSLAAAGDAQARRELVLRLQGRVRSVALAILGNAHDAEDAMQAIMVEVLASTGGYRGDNLLAWADRIAARTAMRHARQRRVRAAQCETSGDLEDLSLSSTAQSFPEHDIPRPLIEYLAELPEARRVTLVLRHVMDYSIEEIAELTSTSQNTVKDRLLHARAQMRRLIRRDLSILGRRPWSKA
jgi:RNA polymerase sigma-70 factor (ECF subfamily)